MKFEVAKTVILILLVGLSLLLTFGLWNHQPNYELLYDPESDFVNEVDIGGIQQTRKTLIQPRSLIFHNDGEYFGFVSPKEIRNFYKKMEDWTLDDIQVSNATGKPKESKLIEITFPSAIPMEISKSLFIVNDEHMIPNWSFEKMYITFNEANSDLNVHFLSTDGLKKAKFTVNSTSTYNEVWSQMEKSNDLSPFVLYKGNKSIYIPVDPGQIKKRSMTIKNIEPTLLVNALFKDPSLVSPNVGEAYFMDGQRGLNVLQDGRSMEFINPMQRTEERMNFGELLDISIDNINEHKGWTDSYEFKEINLMQSEVLYRMHYEGYPVYNNHNLSIVEQQWLNHELHQYRRPLFSLNTLLGGEAVQLQSGNDVILFLENNSDYRPTDINAIEIGYRLTYLDGSSYSAILEPAWFVDYKGSWQEINFSELDKYPERG